MQSIIDKEGVEYKTVLIEDESSIPDALVLAYCTGFWNDAWGELLVDGDPSDPKKTNRLFGSNDPTTGKISDEMQQIADSLGLDTNHEDWHVKLWHLAGEEKVRHPDGTILRQCWTMDRAKSALQSFVGQPYNGKLILLMSNDECAGFSSYCIGGRDLVLRRFPMYEPHADQIPQENCGIFLDHAICSKFRKLKLGGKLFDLRISAIQNDRASWIVGQTTASQPAQFEGNYKKRGLTPVINSPKNPEQWLFISSISDIKPR